MKPLCDDPGYEVRSIRRRVVASPGGAGEATVAGIYAQGWETTQLTSALHAVALSKTFEPPLLAM